MIQTQTQAVNIYGATVSRGDLQLCANVSLSLSAGTICHIIGKNGLGKTTLLMQMVGLLPHVAIDVQKPLLYIGHEIGIHEALSIHQNLRFLVGLYGMNPSNAALEDALSWVGLAGFSTVLASRLSAGQKRRVGLARLFLCAPEVTPVWVLDEPLTALDVAMVHDLSECLQAFARQGGTVILTSHQEIDFADEVLDLAQFVAIDEEELWHENRDDSATQACAENNRLQITYMNEGSGGTFLHLLQREWQIKQSGMMTWIQPLIIFLMIVTLFPLSSGSEPELLLRLGVPMVWIGVLLSLVIGADGLFKSELDNGSLAQIIVSPTPLALWVLVRCLVHWVFGAGLVAVLSLLACPFFGLNLGDGLALMASVLVGSPMLLAISAIASSLTLSVKNSAVLVPLIAIPMQLPVLIFATGAVERFSMQLAYLPIFALLLAGSLIAMITMPYVVAWNLKMAWQS